MLTSMLKRLQVLVEDAELQEFRRVARGRRMTTAEWVRQSLRAACAGEAGPGTQAKLDAVRAAAGHDFPTADIDQMLAEVELGYQ